MIIRPFLSQSFSLLSLCNCILLCHIYLFFLTTLFCSYLCQTALHLAVIVDQPECVRGLLWGGASAELQERGGNTPLHLAVRELRMECVRELTSCPRLSLEHLTITNYSGKTPCPGTLLRLHGMFPQNRVGSAMTLIIKLCFSDHLLPKFYKGKVLSLGNYCHYGSPTRLQ